MRPRKDSRLVVVHAVAFAVFLLLQLLATGCSGNRKPAAAPPTLGVPVERGIASWYGPRFNGRMTASGERYDMNALTAAHRSLPFGTRLRVVNLDNDRVVEVRVNDRGPMVPGRILDLSYAAARALGAVGTGVIPVRITVLSER